MRDKFVVDASVAVKWFIREEYSDNAFKLLQDFTEGKIELIAPESFKLEFANAIREYLVRGLISKSFC